MQIGHSIMDTYTTLYTAGGIPALVSTAITIIYFTVKLIAYTLNAGTRETKSRKRTLHNSLPRHKQGSTGGTEGPCAKFTLNIPRYNYETDRQWPRTVVTDNLARTFTHRTARLTRLSHSRCYRGYGNAPTMSKC